MGVWGQIVWPPLATCGGGLDAPKTRDMAILEGDLEARRRETWKLRCYDWTVVTVGDCRRLDCNWIVAVG